MLRQLENSQASLPPLKKQKNEKKDNGIAILLDAISSNNLTEVQRIMSNALERPSYQEISASLSKPILLSLEGNDDATLAPVLKSILVAYEKEIAREDVISAFYMYCKTNYQECLSILACPLLMELGHALVRRTTWLQKQINNKIEAVRYLINRNISYEGNEVFYTKVIKSSKNNLSIAKTIVFCMNHHIRYSSEKALYQLILNSRYPQEVAHCCVLLHQNFPFEENVSFYKMLSNKQKASFEILERAFSYLNQCNIPVEKHIKLCENFIFDENYADILSESIYALKQMDIFYDKNQAIYEALIAKEFFPKNRNQIEYMLLPIPILVRMDCSDKKIIEICKIIGTMDIEGIERIGKIFFLADRAGMKFSDFPKEFCKNKLFMHDKLILFVLKNFSYMALYIETHPKVFQSVFGILNEMNTPYQLILEIIEKMSNYLNELNENESGGEKELSELDRIIQESCAKPNELTEGPLNKSIGTQKIEELLHFLSTDYNKDHDYISFNQMEEYILTIPGQEVINLSLLLRNANLSHMVLSQDLINKIECIIMELIPELEMKHENEVVRLLPKIQQAAFNEYTSQKYRNINRLFRSEALEPKSKKAFHVDPSKNRLCCFLLGCLLNDAVNRLRCLQEKIPEKEAFDALINHYMRISQYTEIIDNEEDLHHLLVRAHEEAVITEEKYDSLLKKVHHTWVSFYEKKILDRGERLDEEIIQRRTANAWRFPALTSFSIFKEGSDYFHEEDTQRTILEGAPYFCVINEEEGEVLLAQGEQVTTSQTPEYLISTIRRSPSLEPKYHYWSEQGLRYAYEHYFSKEYQDEESMIECGGEKVMRPNHNIVHTYRVMLLVERVVAYFAEYANDLKFKIFCQDFTEKALEWLRVGAVFSVTGRENERSASENREQYDSYRIASGQHFLEFVQKTSPYDIIMKERIHDVVRYMGNPHYESTLNQHENVNEQENRNFYHRILTVAHKLDLPRCFTAEEFQKSMKCIDVLSESSESQQEALEEMIRYNIALIKIHGDNLCCDIDFDGNWFDCNREYQPSYGRVSNSLKALFERTALVTEPSRRRYHL